MTTRKLQVLILGEVPEVGDIFERSLFQEELPTASTHVVDPDEFGRALDRNEPYDLVLIDITPHGIEVLKAVREHLPACPVVMIGDPNEGELLLEAKRKGLEAYLLRALDDELFTDLLAEEIYTQLERFVEPPKMKSPSADQMYRHAQYHNVLEPFFVVARERYLLYVNKAGRDLIDRLHGNEPQVGAPLEEWVLEASFEEFTQRLDQGFAGHEFVHERNFENLDEDGQGVRELHYQPVHDPMGRVVAVSVAVSQPARPERQRARTMQQLSELAASVSHENNNLLNVLMSNADLLSDRLAILGDDDALKRMDKIQRAIQGATQFTHQLQAFSRTSVSQPEFIDSSEMLESLEESLDATFASNIVLVLDLELNLPAILVDPGHWQTVVTNLVQNGAREMSDGGELHIKTRSLQVPLKESSLPIGPGSYVLLEFTFEGRVLTGWVGTRSFDPYFAKRRVDRHAGLELATVKSIVEQGSGGISAAISDEKTVLRIYYPTAEPPTSDPSTIEPSTIEQEAASSAPSEQTTILLVEDEAFLYEAVAEILTSHDYNVLTAASVTEARALYEERSAPVNLLIADVVIPGGSATDLVDELINKWPQLDVIFVSGHPPHHLPHLDEVSSRQLFLRKPVPIPTLLQAVEELLTGGTE